MRLVIHASTARSSNCQILLGENFSTNPSWISLKSRCYQVVPELSLFIIELLMSFAKKKKAIHELFTQTQILFLIFSVGTINHELFRSLQGSLKCSETLDSLFMECSRSLHAL